MVNYLVSVDSETKELPASVAAALPLSPKTIESGSVVGDNLVLVQKDGTNVTAGNVRGPAGPAGPNSIPTAEFVATALAPIAPDYGVRAVGKGEIVVRVADYFASDRVAGPSGTIDDAAVAAALSALTSLTARGGTLLIDTQVWVTQGIDLALLGKPVKIATSAPRQGELGVHNSVSTSSPIPFLIGHSKPSPWSAGLRHEVCDLRINGNNRAVRVISLVNAHAVSVHDNQILFPSPTATGGSCLYINADGEGISWENKIFGNRMEAGSGDTEANWAEYCLDIRSSDNHIEKNVLLRAKTAHVYNTGGDNTYIQNHAFYGPNHFVSAGNFGATWIANIADGPGIVGFRNYANDTVLHGNRVFWPGDVPATFVAGIEIMWSISNASIQGNVVHADTDTTGLLTATNRLVVRLAPAPSTIIKDNPGAAASSGLGLEVEQRLQMTYPSLTPSGGNVRGAGSADLQFIRSAANQVPSGAASFTAGSRNLVSGNNSGAVGELHNVQGNHSYVVGRYAWDHQINAATVHGGGRFSSNGDMQVAEYVMAAATTSTTKTRLTTNADTLTNQTSLSFSTTAITAAYTIDILGLDKTNGDVVLLRADVVLTKGATAASAVVVGGTTWTTVKSSGAGSTAAAEAIADTTRGGVALSITAPNANSWRWVARIRGIETS